MKKVLAIFLIMIFISHIVIAKSEQNDLITIADAITDNGLEVDTWEVTLKEHITNEKMQKIIQEIQHEQTFLKKENENSIIYSVLDTHKKGTISVNYKVVHPKNNAYSSELVVTISGSNWDKKIESAYLNNVSQILNTYFTENVKIFACMSTQASAIIEFDKKIDFFIKKLELRQITTQKDSLNSTKINEIMYGYTPLIGSKITIQDTLVNVQIVTKTLSTGDVQYLIGTPILINEY
ncbi:YwmB family TATA-box binding protein [Ornithinibacillus halotolerans]|uniref:TATA-box binding protein n=1 Tax=Ornithinibacillus halotolerans TaxID=1274357 RepID=A0A916RPZ5_9BACI|nr:YwmB family TATA-box binding protein [Ornithinibacillus halotolerans]GGA64371.1 hypothetical protein GCM10008025_05270 [Ornithinibacillus halotolerans]